ncbi:MAG: hypothetical protein EPO06_03235 [Burkholderiaceae bacterium]|nr:MAG: hypothetical protein EPO06_03235 [Burkholderiaceae bacterium]
MNKPSHLLRFTIVWLALVTFIYPIPHTIALRNLLLLIGMAALLYALRPTLRLPSASLARTALVILGLLSAWLVLQTSMLSLDPQESFSALRGDWLIVCIVCSLGLLTGALVEHGTQPELNAAHLISAVAIAGLAHMVWLLGYQMWLATSSQSFWGQTPFAAKDYQGVIANFLLALLLAEAVYRSVWNRRCLPWPNLLLWLALVVTCLGSISILARIAVIVDVVLVIATCLAYMTSIRLSRKKWAHLALVATVTLALTAWSVGLDKRWTSFLSSAKVATQIDTQRYWLDLTQPPPRDANGDVIEESAYLRTAWATVALREIQRHPLGVGYGHKAFGIAVKAHYGVQNGLETSHSGLLDFTLANGFPGLALWLALSGVLMVLGWRTFRTGNPVGLMLFLFVLGYLVRCALDSNLSGWRLESYALVTGLLTALTLRAQKA